MTDVSFSEEPVYPNSRSAGSVRTSRLTSLAMKSGLATTEKGAQIVLGVVAAILLVAAGWYYYAHTTHLPSEREAHRLHPELDPLNTTAH